jgi:hypothetical protein
MLGPRPQSANPRDLADDELAVQLERIIRRVKQSMNYRGSYSTRDILGSLVARWIQSGEWQRLRQLPSDQRHLGESVRRFILDRLDHLRRRGKREELDELTVTLPDDQELADIVELAELRAWIAGRVVELAAGVVDARVRVPLAHATEAGQILQLHLDGKTQREIAAARGVSLGLVNKRIAEGTSYLAVLQGIECGLL